VLQRLEPVDLAFYLCLADVITPHIGRVAIAAPLQVRVIAHAKIKTNKIDVAALAKLYACNFLSEAWSVNARTLVLQHQVSRA
jgi:transposase